MYDYLDFAKPPPSQEEGAPTFLSDIMETWGHASQFDNDNIMSAVPVTLALLLRILARDLNMVSYGLGICRTLLQKQRQELIARNLSADKGKEFVISPTLRLLREVLCFDGAALAKSVFRARNFTFRSLARNMSIKYLGEGHEDRKRPSSRTTAVRFFLSALKFLHLEAKRELLLQKDVVFALTRTIKEDPPYLVIEILTTLKAHVLLDPKLPREAKSRILNSHTLSRISPLYAYEEPSAGPTGSQSVAEAAHEFLLFACRVPQAGLLRPESGWYPRGTGQEDGSLADARQMDDVGVENIVWMDKFRQEIPVHNTVLSDFVQGLRPWSNIKQAELLVSIFEAAPELVADYFLKKKTFTFEPKLSATWVGYAALLFNTVTVDAPKYLGHPNGYSSFPPPTSVVVDNILPLPLSQKVLIRSLSHKSNLISFFATRLLVAAMEKLDTVVKLHREASHANKHLWDAAARQLVDEFCQRSPSMKDVVNSYRSIPEDAILHREAASRLVRLYYEVIPQIALIAKFDVSPLLVVAIRRLEKGELEDSRDRSLSLKELENLLAVARYSPGMRWFSNLDGLSLSPFVTLLRLTVDTKQGLSSEKVLDILSFITKEQELVVSSPTQSGLVPIVRAIQSLKAASRDQYIAEVWAFLDNCMSRCAIRPVKYLGMTEELVDGGSETPAVSPLVMAMLEQLPSAIQAGNNKALPTLARFLAYFVGFSKHYSEDDILLDQAFRKFRACFPSDSQVHLAIKIPPVPESANAAKPVGNGKLGKPRVPNSKNEEHVSRIDAKSVEELFQESSGFELENSALTRWPAKTVDELIDDGYAAKLVALLASEHTSIRKEALTNILKMAAKIRESDHEEKEQCWLLLSELAESAKGHIDDTPLPNVIVAFACHALGVLRDPLHGLYAKVNTFLTRGPVWKLDMIPLVYDIIQEELSVDDSYYSGLSWLASYLLDSLRTPGDLSLFHKKRLFERLLSLMSNPYMRAPLKTRFLRLLYQTTCIEGGSTTLTTRFGIVSWLESQKASNSDDDGWVYEAMMKRVWETADQDKITTWSKGAVKDVVEI